ncbi:rho-related GTP-binding protein RhoH [Anolis carolinensis]|nr:PREDICTED: rho-related GTP-binding protein RhoH [Anolis carolinensis]XP_008109830.1 PREDICTED: rho-related GTP-binding protein RhoH [Anolis carolinensis]|eukprot:XP_008109828.1 PREDICTED: rho-related GTP-binding protein RhoH [Anolis carolinensis]
MVLNSSSLPGIVLSNTILDSEEMLDSVKCVLVGDSAVGKTALLLRFTSETFPDMYRPTVYENTGVDVFLDGVQISLGLWDTAGGDSFKGIRPLSYQQADVVLMCFSVANRNSFLNLRNKWVTEIRTHLPRIPILVVATQTDQRETGPHSAACISPVHGKRLAKDIRAKGYVECSSLTNRGVQQVFECAVRTAVNQAKKRARRNLFSVNECKVF